MVNTHLRQAAETVFLHKIQFAVPSDSISYHLFENTNWWFHQFNAFKKERDLKSRTRTITSLSASGIPEVTLST